MTEKPKEITNKCISIYSIFLIFCCIGIIVLGIHIQIPDQGYCDRVFENKYTGGFGSVYYLESLQPYDYSFNQSKCIYNEGTFIANPKYSIWGIRL
jgi:hypothetical protein